MASALLVSVAFAGLVSAQAAHAQSAPAREGQARFDIAPQDLAGALADFAVQSGLQVSIDAERLHGRRSSGVRGTMPPRRALAELLASSGMQGRIEAGTVVLAQAARPKSPPDSHPASDGAATSLGPLRVEGMAGENPTETGAQRDARRKDAVYDRDMSSTYAGKEEIERYKGVNTADVLKGMVNVFSGDARNGGAIDPSIRGIQGPGRVPVIIDGTEQALTVWRGYNGASNRSYIDPSLISGLEVLKGPVTVRGVSGSTGGAVVIDTLDADDILEPDQTFGIEMKLEGANNSTDPRLPTLLTGQDYRDIEGFTDSGVGPTYPYGDPSLRVNLRTSQDNELLSLGDRAMRIAVAGRLGELDLFGAYAYRKRGNYYSGTTGASYYQQEDTSGSLTHAVQQIGLNYEPENEVPNTSSQLESILLKATWHIDADQALQIGFRDSRTKFGEILPSRIMSSSTGYGDIQWPLSKVHAQAFNAQYTWQPDSRWIDLDLRLWATNTISDTYTAGGFPNVASEEDPIIINTALSNSDNDRYGFNLSNTFSPTSRLDIVLDASWQHEKLRSDDEYSDAIANGWRQYPRAGRREEYRINLSGEWRMTPFLKLNGGITYSGYWAKDDFLPKLIEYNGGSISRTMTTSYSTSYETEGYGVEDYEAYLTDYYSTLFTGLSSDLWDIIVAPMIATSLEQYAADPFTFTTEQTGADWLPDSSGRFSRAGNICLNGSLDSLDNYAEGSCSVTSNQETFTITEAKRKSGHGWAPHASATVTFSDSARAYLRFAKAYRFPSMFESTIGFAASINPLQDLKPERITSWEVAYIQDLRPLFQLYGEDQHADVKLTWYHNTTRDVIERTTGLLFSNLDKQVIAGFELQARFDNGRFFTDLSAGHMTTNKACDESVAARMDASEGRIPNCVKYGFMAGFLLTQATPEDTVNWTVGGRFFQRRLELGSRLTWYSAYDNPQIDEWGDPYAEGGCIGACSLNIPYTWGEIITVDAYARFQLNERVSAELTGLNLNDRYYLDPLSRSLMPAPGRTFRMSLTARF